MKKLLIGLALITSVTSFAEERGFSNSFKNFTDIETIESGQTIYDKKTIRNLLSGDIRVSSLKDNLCLTKLLKNSRILADIAIGKKIIGLKIIESTVGESLLDKPILSSRYDKTIVVYPIYQNKVVATAKQTCLLKED